MLGTGSPLGLAIQFRLYSLGCAADFSAQACFIIRQSLQTCVQRHQPTMKPDDRKRINRSVGRMLQKGIISPEQASMKIIVRDIQKRPAPALPDINQTTGSQPGSSTVDNDPDLRPAPWHPRKLRKSKSSQKETENSKNARNIFTRNRLLGRFIILSTDGENENEVK